MVGIIFQDCKFCEGDMAAIENQVTFGNRFDDVVGVLVVMFVFPYQFGDTMAQILGEPFNSGTFTANAQAF